MTQKARPASDVSTGGWTPTPVYAEIDEASPDDGTFVTAPVGGGSFVVKLAPIAAPAAGATPLTPTLTIRLSGPSVVLVELLQETTVIASRTYSPGASFAAFVMTLTAVEAAGIVYPADPTQDPDLRVRVTDQQSGSGGGIVVTCCANTLSSTLYATLSGFGTIALNWDGTYWSGSTSIDCAVLYLRYSTDCSLEFKCDSEAWKPTTCTSPIEVGCISCGPPFVAETYELSIGGAEACPGCGISSISVSVSE